MAEREDKTILQLDDIGELQDSDLIPVARIGEEADNSTTVGAIKNHVKADSAFVGKANKSEMSFTDGEEADADKTTIQLKNGTSRRVLISHQDISGKENTSNKVTAVDDESSDEQYPSAKCVYDNIRLISRVVVEALVSLKAENDGLKAIINGQARRINAEEYRSCGFPMMLSGYGAPSASVIPNEWTDEMGVWTGVPMVPGQEYFDTQSNKWYKAKMPINGAISDWLLLN